MIKKISGSKIIIIGGNSLCYELLHFLFKPELFPKLPRVLGIVDSNILSNVFSFATFKNICVYDGYNEINVKNIDLIIVTISNFILDKSLIKKFNRIEIINYTEIMYVLSSLKIDEVNLNFFKNLKKEFNNFEILKKIFKKYSEKIKNIVIDKNRYFHVIETEVINREREVFQIIEGSTIPTFVINKNHVITHWNRAIEKLTGYEASNMIGSLNQWLPFWKKPRPTMADIILDQLDEKSIENLYRRKWKKSELVNGGYEAELFFSKMGDNGRWIFFTAAPIKSSDGSIIGAIETLWDSTEKKKVESERKIYISKIEEKEKSLTQIIQGSTLPTFVIDKKHVITHWNKAIEKLTNYEAFNMIGTKNQWLPFWEIPRSTMADVILDQVDEEYLENLYNGKWKKSELINGGYEAELFFSKMGSAGKWLFFTAAPIKSVDGSIIGAIETFWDNTEKKKVESERKHYTIKIEEKEKTLTQIIQGSTVPTFVINENHIVTHWNYALEKMTNYRAIDIVGTKNHWKPFSKVKCLTMADIILDKLEKGDKGFYKNNGWLKSKLIDGAFESESFFENLGKTGKWLFFTAAPIKSSYNSIVGVIQTFWDVSVSKQAEIERQRYTDELSTLCSIYTELDTSSILNVKIQNTIEEIREFVGASRIALYKLNNEDLFKLHYFSSSEVEHNLSIKEIYVNFGIIDKLSKTRKPIKIDKNNCKDKVLVYVLVSGKNKRKLGVMKITKKVGTFSSDDLYLLDLIGNRIGVTIENDILNVEIEKKSRFQSKLIRSANDGIIATDENWNTVIFNPSAEKMFDYGRKNFLLHNDIRNFFPKKSLEILQNDAVLSNTEDPSPWCEMKIFTKKEKSVSVRFSGSVLREKNKMIGTVAFFQDLRKIKRLEKELIQSEKLATVGQTVAGMAHCIKNILHGFKGGRYLMNVGTTKSDISKIKNGWAIIQKNINRTSDLVMDLLTYSKEREPEIVVCDPNEIVNDVYDLLIGVAREHGVKLIKKNYELSNEFFLDPRIVHRCIMNLVTNAIDACLFDSTMNKKHFVIIKTEVVSKKIIRFSVKDNGCGMDKEVSSKLFSSLFSTKGIKGTGLGLLVTAKLVEEHKGKIEFISKPGKGTIFFISLPLN